MDLDESYSIREEARVEDEFQCPYCRQWIGGYAAVDPILDDNDEPVCDMCSSDLVNLQS